MSSTALAGPLSPLDEENGFEQSHRWRRPLQALVLAIPVVMVLILGWTHRSMNDDGFIYLRIVRQIEAGNGPVFNAGERVETYTGVIWLGILTIADLITPFTLEWLAIVLGLALTCTGVALMTVAARSLWGATDDRSFFVPLGALAFVAIHPTWVFATGGLETGLVFAWLGASLWVLARWAGQTDRSLTVPECALIGIGWLVRPELALLSGAILVMVLASSWRDDDWRRRTQVVVAVAAAPVLYQVFRMGYFGSIVANTATAKDGSSADWERGRRYFFDFVEPYRLWVPAIGLALAGYVPLIGRLIRSETSRRLAVTLVFLGCGAASATYVVAVGGDYLHARLFLPALFMICAPVAVVPATRTHVAGLAVAAWAIVAMVAFRPDQLEPDGRFANGFVMTDNSGLVTLDDFGWGEGGEELAWFDGPGYYYEQNRSYVRLDLGLRDDLPDSLGALHAVGIAGYAVGPDFFVFDTLGLGDVLTSHFEATPTLIPFPRLAGHEKPSPASWIAARLTPTGSSATPEDFPAFPNPLIPPTTGFEFQEQVAWARAALRCDAIVDLLASANEPLTVKRFVKNLVGSPGRARLKIPGDPEEAYRQFCGADTPVEVESVRSAAGS